MNLFRGRNIYILFFFKHQRVRDSRNSDMFDVSKNTLCPAESHLTFLTPWLDNLLLDKTMEFLLMCLVSLFAAWCFFFFLNHYYSSMWFQPQVKCVQLQGPSGAVQLNVYNKAGWWNGKSLCIRVTCHIQFTVTLYRLLRLGGDPTQC